MEKLVPQKGLVQKEVVGAWRTWTRECLSFKGVELPVDRFFEGVLTQRCHCFKFFDSQSEDAPLVAPGNKETYTSCCLINEDGYVPLVPGRCAPLFIARHIRDHHR